MKTLLRNICAGLALVSASVASADSVMSWMLDMSEANAGYQNVKFDAIKLYAQQGTSGERQDLQVASVGDEGGAPTWGDSVAVQLTETQAASSEPALVGPYVANLSTLDTSSADYSDYLFFVELLNNDTKVGWSTTGIQANSAAIASYFGGDLDPIGGVSGTTPVTFGEGVVPEPTSGLLLLVGGALLALRRRRKAVGAERRPYLAC